MDSSLHKPFQLFCLSLALFSCNLFSSADLIGDVCSGTKNPSFCSTTLRSDPRSGNADLKVLGEISIKLSTDKFKQTNTVILPGLRSGEKNSTLLGIYGTCTENYGDGVDDLNDASADLRMSDFLGMSLSASAAEADIDTCDDSFSERKVIVPQKLADASKTAHDLVSIVLAIASRLRG